MADNILPIDGNKTTELLAKLKNKYGKDPKSVTIELEDGENGSIKLMLSSPDYQDLMRETTYAYEIEYHIAEERGMDKIPLTDARFEEYLSRFKDENTKKSYRESRPKTVAEMAAKTLSLISAVPYILPKYLRFEDGTKAFKTDVELNEFILLVQSSMDLQTKLIEGYTALSKEIEAERARVKNKLAEPGETKAT